MRAQYAAKVRVMDRIPAKRIFKTPAGDTVIDFAQNMAGRIEVTAAGKPGDVIELHCFEVLDKDGNVYLDNLRAAKAAMKYTFAREENCYLASDLYLHGISVCADCFLSR